MQAFYRQLSSWLLHGRLSDPYGEFFIVPATSTQGASDAAATAARSGGGALPLSDDGGDGGAAEWHEAFVVDMIALPPGIELTTAEAARFVGRAVRVLTQPKGAFASRRDALLPPEESAAAAAALAALAAAPAFEPAAFAAAVESLRAAAAARLWQLVVGEAALPAHLKALRDYALMGRGDFWAAFLEEAGGLLRMPPRGAGAEAALRPHFAAAAAKSTAADDPLFGHLRIRFRVEPPSPGAAAAAASVHAPAAAPAAQQTQGQAHASAADATAAAAAAWAASAADMASRLPSFDAWDGICIEYAVDWPLGLLLAPEALARYNTLFSYLLRLRRCERVLEAAWVALRRKPGRAPLLALRHNIQFLVSCWVHYIQAREALNPKP